MLYYELKDELENICNENGLKIDFNLKYPIMITIRNQMQINMFQELPKESYLRFTFLIDQINFNFVGDFKIDDKLFSKLFNKIKKFHYIYLQEWYSQKDYRIKNCIKPLWETSKGDCIAIIKKGFEG